MSKPTARMWALWLGLCIALSLALAGCGPSAGTETERVPTLAPEEPTESSPGTTPVATGAEGEELSILRVGGVQGPDCLNPWSCTYTWAHQYLVMEGLTGTGPGCQAFPRLAKSWSVSDDGRTSTFILNEGAKFTDGTPVTAGTVVEWMKWFNATDLKWWYYTSWNMTDVKAIDDYTLEFTTETALNPDVVSSYDLVWWWVFPPHVWSEIAPEEIYTYEALPIGTGPYDMVENKPGEYVIYDAREDYYAGKPPVDRVVNQIYGNWDAVVEALLAGEIDLTDSMLPVNYYSVLSGQPGIVLEERPPGFQRALYFNMAENGNRHGAIADSKVREAIDYAIDRETALAVVLEGHGLLCPNNIYCGPLHQEDLNPDLEITPFDPEKASQLLDEAGYADADADGVRETKDGQPLQFRVIVEQGQPIDLALADQVSGNLASIGIATETEVLELGTLSNAMLAERDYDIAIHRFWPDLDAMLIDFYFSCWSAEAGQNAINRSGYCNEEVDALVKQYATTPNRTAARQFVFQAQAIMHEDRPMLTIVGENMLEAMNTARFDFPTPGNSCDMNAGFWNWPLVLQVKPK